jgi:hypothetical protein
MESPVRFKEEVDDLGVLMRTLGSPENQAAIEAGGVVVESAGAFTLVNGSALTRMRSLLASAFPGWSPPSGLPKRSAFAW